MKTHASTARQLYALVGLLGLASTGCQELGIEIPGAPKADAAKGPAQPVAPVPAAAASTAASTGLELSFAEQVKVDRCFVRLIQPAAGRPKVVQVSTYLTAGDESFPSVFLQGDVQVQTPHELAGKTIRARLFVTMSPTGPTYFSATNEPVELRITTLRGPEVVGEIVRGNLVSADGANLAQPGVSAVTGKFTGTLQDTK